MADKPKNGVQLIAKERERQIYVEGYETEHDDTHTDQQMVYAAVCYALKHTNKMNLLDSLWPEGWVSTPLDYPSDPILDLVKGGALIAAEIDRLQRMEASQ